MKCVQNKNNLNNEMCAKYLYLKFLYIYGQAIKALFSKFYFHIVRKNGVISPYNP